MWRADQGGESKAAVDFEEIGEDSIFASDEQQKEVECTADEDSCRLIQREWEGAVEGGKRLGRVAGTENAGGSDRSNLRENSNDVDKLELAPKKGAALFDKGKVLQQNLILRGWERRAVYSSQQGGSKSLWKAVLNSLAEAAVGEQRQHTFAVEEREKANDVLWG